LQEDGEFSDNGDGVNDGESSENNKDTEFRDETDTSF
jgi:hypothetical protein